MKFLIDECLSPELTILAHAKGYGESSHVVWLGRAGLKDWELKPIILDGDWTFVTKNSVDFRGPAERPGAKGQYADVTLHAGLVCLNGPPSMDLDMQLELFEQALDELEVDADFVNQVLEITWEEDALHTTRYQLPATEP
jgi:predicted nuclease of predicted toxin-antitoxin system